jgi:hypothetical protein
MFQRICPSVRAAPHITSLAAMKSLRLITRKLSAKAEGQADVDGSRYENYHEAAQIYDGIRHAGGSEVILGAFASGGSGVPLHQQAILDVGCGTGAITHPLLACILFLCPSCDRAESFLLRVGEEGANVRWVSCCIQFARVPARPSVPRVPPQPLEAQCIGKDL